MAETETTTLNTSTTMIDADRIDVPDRMRALDDGKVSELVESIGRQGLMQPIGVRYPDPPSGGGRYTLIWGAHRLAAYRRTDVGRDHIGHQYITAVCYDPDLPDPWMRILEIEENLRRKELTVQEKAEHTIRLAAELKELASPKSRNLSEFSNSDQEQPKPTTGRGHKGIVQKLAEQVNVDHGTVRHRARKAAEAIGEPIDLDKDSPAELRRKADKLKATPKAKRIRKPKPIDGDREPKPKQTKPDLAELVATLNALWSPRDVERYEPTEQQLSMLKLNAPNVVRKLQSLALRFDYPITSTGLSIKTKREIERVLAEEQPAEALAEAEQPAADSADGLRDRLRAVLTKLEMSETRFAKHADMSQGTLNRYMLGIGKINKANRAKIETALGDLAEYANAAPVGTGAALA
jgi:ParB-like chromosome segregation protein Spo0J